METSLSNEERRKAVLQQHAHLRRTLFAAQAAARELLAGRGAPGEFWIAVTALKIELLEHLADEERLLAPVIERLDAWGPVRAALLRAEHSHQRAVLAVLADPSSQPAATLVAQRTLGMCADLLEDMEFEERELLTDRVMRDDLVLLDASDAG